MDGNGRWAKKIGRQRIFGHETGAESVNNTIEASLELGIKNVTLYAFSMENWMRPKIEVNALMNLLVKTLEKQLESLMKNDIKLCAVGDLSPLKKQSKEKLSEVILKTSKNKKLVLNLAISYGSRQEIENAFKLISQKVKNNIISVEKIDEKIINDHLYTRNLPNVDLLIRTGGEHRISNFLLWQIAYAEFYFVDVLWPDFKKEDFFKAIINYQTRDRRFGKINSKK